MRIQEQIMRDERICRLIRSAEHLERGSRPGSYAVKVAAMKRELAAKLAA